MISKQKNFNVISCLFLGILLVSVPAMAQYSLPVYEPFDYPGGTLMNSTNTLWDLVDQTGEDLLSATGSLTAPVGMPASIGNSMQLGIGTGLSNSGDDARFDIADVSGGSLYMSFLVDFATAPASFGNDYIISLRGTREGASAADTGRVYAMDVGGGNFAFGLDKRDTIASATGTPIAYNQTHLIVLKWENGPNDSAVDDVFSIYINPDPAAAEPTVADATSADGDDLAEIDAFGVRQDVDSSILVLDELRIATTWSEAMSTTMSSVKDWNDY